MTSTTERFFAKIDKHGPVHPTLGPCWVWTAGTSSGYGIFCVGRSDRLDRHGKRQAELTAAHRFSWELHHGTIPAGIKVDHRCHRRDCCNPDHLRLVTDKQNHENRSGAPCTSQSGIRGVRRVESGRWAASLTHYGRSIHVGTFDTVEQADDAVRLKRLEVFTHNDIDRQGAGR